MPYRHRVVSAALISEAVDVLARAGRPAPPGELTRPGEDLVCTPGEDPPSGTFAPEIGSDY